MVERNSFQYLFRVFSPKKMVPTVNKNYSILSTVFCSIFFDDFLELLFSPFTKNFASAVSIGNSIISSAITDKQARVSF